MTQQAQLDANSPVPAPAAPADASAKERMPERQYCVFRAGRESYCLSILEVEEVAEWPSITRVPLTPAFLLGVFNLRGVIVPVVDIAAREVRPVAQAPKHLVVAAVRGEGDRGDLRMGLVADEVLGTFSTAEPLMVEEAPRNVPHCCGVLRYDGRLALALELRRLVGAFPISVI